MSAANYTPGPWVTSSLPNGTEWTVSADGGDMLADLTGCPNEKANARLIAAAPELLAALQAIMGDPDAVDHILYLDAVAADAAIAKATGGDM